MRGKSRDCVVGGVVSEGRWLVVPWLVLWVVPMVEAIGCVGLRWLGGENKKE